MSSFSMIVTQNIRGGGRNYGGFFPFRPLLEKEGAPRGQIFTNWYVGTAQDCGTGTAKMQKL